MKPNRLDAVDPFLSGIFLPPKKQVADDASNQVAGDREPDALVAAALGEDRGVDADQLGAAVNQCATGVAGVDRRIGLDEVFVQRDAHVRAAERAHDAERHRLAQRKRTAHGHHPFGDLQLR